MSKPSAIAFAVVVLFVAVAGFLVYRNLQGNFQGGRFPPPPDVSQPPVETSLPAATLEPLALATPTPALWASPTPTEASAAPTTTVPTATLAPAASATPPAATASPTHTATSTPTSAPTTSSGAPAPSAGSFAFSLDGPVVHDLQAACTAQYLAGYVRDKAGNPLEGVRVRASDQWGNVVTTATKGGPDIGKWDIVLSGTPNVWNLVILDAAGNAISPAVPVPHHQDGEYKNACTHLANWRRAW